VLKSKLVPALAALLVTTHFAAARPAEPDRDRPAFGSQLPAPRPPRLIRTSLDAAPGEPLLSSRSARLIHTSLDADQPAHLAALPPRKVRSTLDGPPLTVAPGLDATRLEQSTSPALQFKRLIRTDLSSDRSAPASRLPARRLRLTLE
jgi:hypothetical protein